MPRNPFSKSKRGDDAPAAAAPAAAQNVAPSNPAAAASQRAPAPNTDADKSVESKANLLARLQDISDNMKNKELALKRAEDNVKRCQLELGRVDPKQKYAQQLAIKKLRLAMDHHKGVAAQLNVLLDKQHTVSNALTAIRENEDNIKQVDAIADAAPDADDVQDNIARTNEIAESISTISNAFKDNATMNDDLAFEEGMDDMSLLQDAAAALAESQGESQAGPSMVSGVDQVPPEVPVQADDFEGLESHIPTASPVSRRTPAGPL